MFNAFPKGEVLQLRAARPSPVVFSPHGEPLVVSLCDILGVDNDEGLLHTVSDGQLQGGVEGHEDRALGGLNVADKGLGYAYPVVVAVGEDAVSSSHSFVWEDDMRAEAIQVKR
jgi:hypothetical protein